MYWCHVTYRVTYRVYTAVIVLIPGLPIGTAKQLVNGANQTAQKDIAKLIYEYTNVKALLCH